MARATSADVLFDESTNETVRAAIPDHLVPVVELSTHLGDGATMVALGLLAYWFVPAHRTRTWALVLAITLGAFALTAGLKGLFLIPRPELPFTPADYPGYAFPSGHALGSAAFYGAVAAVATIGTRRQRYAAAGAIVLLVSLSRVVLGVHYLGDVLVGMIIGFGFVAVVVRVLSPHPTRVFVLACVVAAAGYLLGSREFTSLSIGATAGAAVVWPLVDRQLSVAGSANANLRTNATAVFVLAVPAFAIVLGVRAASVGWDVPRWLEIVSYALAIGFALAVPVFARSLEGWPPLEWVTARLPAR